MPKITPGGDPIVFREGTFEPHQPCAKCQRRSVYRYALTFYASDFEQGELAVLCGRCLHAIILGAIETTPYPVDKIGGPQ